MQRRASAHPVTDSNPGPLVEACACHVQVWICLLLMLGSAGVGASTDTRFSWRGYSWQMVNCLFTSAYALYLRSVMDTVAEHTTNKQRMDEFSMVRLAW